MTDSATQTSGSASPFALSPTSRRFLLKEFRRRMWLVMAIFVGGALNAFLEVAGLALVFPLLAVVMRPEAIQMVPFAGRITSALGISSQRDLIAALIVAIALLTALKNVYMVSFYWWHGKATARWKADLSRRMMRLYLMSDLRMHIERAPATMIRNLSYAGLVFDQYILAILGMMVTATIAIGIAVLLALALPAQTLFGVGTLSVGAAALFYLTRGKFNAIGKENQELYRVRGIVLQSGIGAIRESKVLGREQYFLDKFTQVEHRSFVRQGHFNFLAALPGLGLETLIILSMLAIVGHVIFITGGGAEGLATIGLLAAAMFRLLPMIVRMMANLQLMSVGKPTLEVIAAELEVNEHRVKVADVKSGERLDWRELQLRNVGLTYPDGTRALHGVTLTIRRGEFVGITGPSGSGKSTLMLILLGLLEPTEGTITVDGVSFNDPVVVRKWQNGIGYVPQDLFLVDGSIAENVAFGTQNPDAAKVTVAVERSQLAEYVASQADGIYAPVGEYGDRLSGGQKQRVVIARALYHDPDLIAFDEATSTLDVETEKALTDHFLQFRSKKSMIAIAHRLGTIQHCDRVIFLEAGGLSGIAPFAELKAGNENFRKLADLSNL